MTPASKKQRTAPSTSPVWTPSMALLESSHWTKFTQLVQTKYQLDLTTPHEVWQWSVENLSQFWETAWEYVQMKSSTPFTKVIEKEDRIEEARFFPGARLNFAENILRYRDDKPAILFHSETSSETIQISHAELYDQVAQLAHNLRQMGIKPGDRVAAYIPNIPQTIVAMLATTSIGGVWSSCSPDFGKDGVLDRFEQISPRVLFTTDGYFYKGRRVDTMPTLKEIVDRIGSLEKVVVMRYTIAKEHSLNLSNIRNAVYLDQFLTEKSDPDIHFEQLPFDHPVYIMYSSGTTGLPKCIVQGPGVLLNHMKEHILHFNVDRSDKVFYFTTTGWMMWNWLVSGIACGASIVLYEGNPLYPDASILWKLAQDIGITVFGTSARYLAAVMESKCEPAKSFDLSALRVIASTGSPATTNIFNFVYQSIKSNVMFASISGGTDLNGCFALGCTNLPVYDGELQMRGLGLDVHVYNEAGEKVNKENGELVCLKPFPSMPLYFWNDEDRQKYHNAYFDVYPNVWRHGDFAEVTCHNGLIIHGRSDATLNPGGVRIGTADIYNAIETMHQITDSVVVGHDYTLADGTPDVEIILFVVLVEGLTLTDDLSKAIRSNIREKTSPRHVPSKILMTQEIPYTASGKKVEIAVKKAIHGQKVLNKNSLRNPRSVDWFEQKAPDLLN